MFYLLRQVVIEKEQTNQDSRKNGEKFKNLVDWMHMLVYTPKTSYVDDGFAYAEKDVDAIKSKVENIPDTSVKTTLFAFRPTHLNYTS